MRLIKCLLWKKQHSAIIQVFANILHEICNDHFTTNSPLSLPVKNFWKPVSIWIVRITVKWMLARSVTVYTMWCHTSRTAFSSSAVNTVPITTRNTRQRGIQTVQVIPVPKTKQVYHLMLMDRMMLPCCTGKNGSREPDMPLWGICQQYVGSMLYSKFLS